MKGCSLIVLTFLFVKDLLSKGKRKVSHFGLFNCKNFLHTDTMPVLYAGTKCFFHKQWTTQHLLNNKSDKNYKSFEGIIIRLALYVLFSVNDHMSKWEENVKLCVR